MLRFTATVAVLLAVLPSLKLISATEIFGSGSSLSSIVAEISESIAIALVALLKFSPKLSAVSDLASSLIAISTV